MNVWGRATIRTAFFLCVLIVPITGSLIRRHRATGCAFDGASIDPSIMVRVVDSGGENFRFCCIQCAVWWLERAASKPEEIFVTDEVSVEEIPANSAFFVRSTVVSQPTTRNRVHAFRRLDDAQRHAEIARGKILSGTDRPFHSNESDSNES